MAARARLRFASVRLLLLYRHVFPTLLTALSLAFLCSFVKGHAQNAPIPSADAPYTLHVYQDLLQLPILVLNRAHNSYGGLSAAQFTLRLDDGPPFHPRHTRLEGDDPLGVALVVDAGQESTLRLAEKLEALALPQLAAWLSPADTISVYALDCHLIRSANELPYSGLRLQATLATALAAPDLHKHDPGMTCGSKRKLWDSLAAVILHLSQSPGRRVVLVVSNGKDETSKMSWTALARYAGRFNTTVMGLRPPPAGDYAGASLNRMPVYARPTERFIPDKENVFDLLCSGTGGLVLPAEPRTIVEPFNRAVDLLRQRYILEFPRPHDDTSGLHRIEAFVPDSHAVVLSAGIAFPPRKSTQDTDPGTVPSDPTQAPQLGHRKILDVPQ